jgi:hypothetical protein
MENGKLRENPDTLTSTEYNVNHLHPLHQELSIISLKPV